MNSFSLYTFFHNEHNERSSNTRSDQVQTQREQPAEDLIRKRVQWTRFSYMENEFVELVFHTWKTSSLNLFSMYGRRVCWTRFLCFVLWNCYKWNRVQRTRIAINEISFKPCLTYTIVWVLCLFLKKKPQKPNFHFHLSPPLPQQKPKPKPPLHRPLLRESERILRIA